jgi:hypothetical protein
MNDPNEVLELASKVLWRCVLWGMIFLMLWAGAFLQLWEVVKIQAMVFGVAPHKVCLINYALMGFMKVLIMVFFVVPFIAIRLVLRYRRPAK